HFVRAARLELGEAEVPIGGQPLGLFALHADLDRAAASPLRHGVAQPRSTEMMADVEAGGGVRPQGRGVDLADAVGAPQTLTAALPRVDCGDRPADEIPAVAIPQQAERLG